MRPLGDLALALEAAATEPATVRALCCKAQVGFVAGRKTASRMVGRGALVVVACQRPALVVARRVAAQYLQPAPQAPDVRAALAELHRVAFNAAPPMT